MMLRISTPQRCHLVALSRAAYPNEACGLLAGERRGDEKIVRAIYLLRNAAPAPARHFRFYPDEQRRVLADIQRRRLSLIGNFHSHPFATARPSEEDVRFALDNTLSYVIVSLEKPRAILKSFLIMGDAIWEEPQRELLETRSGDPRSLPSPRASLSLPSPSFASGTIAFAARTRSAAPARSLW